MSEQEHAPANLKLTAAERAAGLVLPASGLVWTAAEIMHLAGQPGGLRLGIGLAVAVPVAGWLSTWQDRIPRPFPAWLAVAGGWTALSAAEGPLALVHVAGYPYPPLTVIGALIAAYGWRKAQKHDAVTGAREWRAAKAGWLGQAHEWRLGGSHLLDYQETRLGERYEIDTRGTGRHASVIAADPRLAEHIAEREGLPAAWVAISRPRLAGRAVISIRRTDPWEKPPVHPVLTGDPEGILPDPCSIRRPVIVGQDPESGEPLEVPLWDEDRGAKNINIVSMAGGGKTVLLNCISERITAAPDAIMVRVNPSIKGSAEVKRWGVACHLTALGTKQGSRAVQVLRAVNAIIEYRAQQDSDTDIFVPSPRDPLIVVMIDESDAVSSIAAARAEVDKISTKGREYGVVLVRAGQRGTTAYGSAAQRSQDGVVCLGGINRPGEAYHAAGSMGLSVPDMTSYGDGKPGVWLVITGGSYQAGRTFLLKQPPDIYRIACDRAFTQPELSAGCRAFLDERLKGQYEQLLSTDVFAEWAREQQGESAPLPDAPHPAGDDTGAVLGAAPAVVPVATLTETDDISSLDWEPDMDDDMRRRLAAIDEKNAVTRRILAETAALPRPPAVSAEALAASTAERWRQVGEQAELSENNRNVLLGMLKDGTTISAVAAALGVTKWIARTYLEKLRNENLVRIEGEKRTARWVLAAQGDES